MEKLKIKICGMRDAANILDVASLSPDYLGFIFYPASPRFVGNDFTPPSGLAPIINRVGVFVNESTQSILAKAKSAGFTFVQLHGNETPDEAKSLKDAGLKVIKVFSIDDEFNFDITQPYQKVVDYFLFDTKGKFYGGNAKTFNWNILHRYDQEVPFFLSGGLTPENLTNLDSLRSMNLHALDLNSGVELSPGVKSKEKVEHIINLTNSETPGTRWRPHTT
jgi:phosphoribosylanthranilate isomerase